jgi:hypothetical protein
MLEVVPEKLWLLDFAAEIFLHCNWDLLKFFPAVWLDEAIAPTGSKACIHAIPELGEVLLDELLSLSFVVAREYPYPCRVQVHLLESWVVPSHEVT